MSRSIVKGARGVQFSWPGLADQVLELEQAGLVTCTFRRLDRERQTAVLEAIIDESAERGLSSLSMKSVAARAQVSVGSLYQYFGKREHLLGFTVELCRRYMEGVLADSLPTLEKLPLAEALSAYVEGGADWMAQQRSIMRLFGQAAYRGDSELTENLVRPVATSMRNIVRELLARSVARGELRRDIDLEATAGVIHTLTVVLGDSRLLPALDAYFQLQVPGVDAGRSLRAALDLLMQGLATASRGDRQGEKA
jgi:TetR/AcrR family transcriptional regulator